MSIDQRTCRYCNRAQVVFLPDTYTGRPVPLEVDPVPLEASHENVTYAVTRSGRARRIRDIDKPPARVYVRHRCPERSAWLLEAEMDACRPILSDVEEFFDVALVYPQTPQETRRRLA